MVGRIWREMLAAASVRFWAMVGASIALTILAAAIIFIVWHGGWPLAQAPRQLDILGKALWIVLVAILIIVVALTAQRVEASGVWGRLNVGGGEDSDKPPATVTITTTKTETKP